MSGDLFCGGFRLNLSSGRLWDATEEVRLTPKAGAVLQVLVSHAGDPVSKQQLFDAVWPDTSVSDDALTSCIQELRRAFKDNPRQPRFIETRHRRGYCFIAPIHRPEAALVTAMPAADLAATSTGANGASVAPRSEAPAGRAIAVLPFADLSQARDQDYLCDGIAEELIAALSNIDGLRVVSRTASFQFRDRGGNVRLVGEQLGADVLLEGSVRKAENRLRITVQLVDVATGYQRWSQRFDRVIDDVFAVQDEIAGSVAALLRGELTREERQSLARPQTAMAAYESYLRARQLLPRMTRPDLVQSAAAFEDAIALDPGYAPAWAGLATVSATLFEWFGSKATDLRRAEDASRTALSLAPDLAESRVARGFVLSLHRRYGEAAEEFGRAIALNPNLFEAHYYFARSRFAEGRIADAADEFQRASEVRREDCQSTLLLAQSLWMMGRIEEARPWTREGIRRAEHALLLNPLDVRALSLGALGLCAEGQVERAREWSRRAIELYPDDVSAVMNGACLMTRLGELDEAMALFERLFAQGFGKRDWIERLPDYQILRDEPRFQAMLARLT